MTLLEIRKLFITLSGRYDLVKDTNDYEDDGANFFLQSGQRLLDSMFTHNKSKGETTLALVAGQHVYSVPYMLSVDGVKLLSDSMRVPLAQIEQDLIDNYYKQGSDLGLPTCYSVFSNLQSPLLENSEGAFKTLAIKVFPVPEVATTAYVYGRVHIPLTEDEDKNFWTLNYPETLMSAAMYQIERFHRNRQGMEDHMAAIMRDLKELDSDRIESELGSLNQMRDSFKFRGEGNVQ